MNKQTEVRSTVEALKLALGELQAGKVGNAMQILREALMSVPDGAQSRSDEEQPAPATELRKQQEPVAWRELCRRLYVELFHCDQQMTATLDEDGEPVWTQGKTVRDVLADAKAALETSPPASKPWVSLTDDEANEIVGAFDYRYDVARAIEAKLREKNA